MAFSKFCFFFAYWPELCYYGSDTIGMTTLVPGMDDSMKNFACVSPVMAIMLLFGCGFNALDGRGDAMRIQPETSSFAYRGMSINYEDRGEGQPLILLHGYGASTYSWRHVAPHFSKSYRVIAIDLKGFGLSDKPLDNDYSVLDQSRMIAEFIRSYRLENVLLAGHSLGGAVALLTYLMQSDQGAHPISKLVLLDTASYPQDLPLFISILRVPVINELSLCLTSNNFKSRMILRKAFFDHSKITEEMVATYGANLSLPGAYHALIKTAKQMLPPDLEEISGRYKSISIPVLLIWGEKDEIVPLEIGRRLAGNIPNAKLVVVPDCGHVPQEECPRQAIEAMESFLSDQTEAMK